MTIIGTVGGPANADPGNAAFSEGFGWANFDVVPSGDSGNRRAGAECSRSEVNCGNSSPNVILSSTKCFPTGDEVSDPTSCDMGAKGSHVVAFFKRAVTCVGIIVLMSLFRNMFRSAQMFLFPDSPPPADMAFPGWVLIPLDPFSCVRKPVSPAHIFDGKRLKTLLSLARARARFLCPLFLCVCLHACEQEGPVFVAQLFGLSDTIVALLTVRCNQWKLFGVGWLLVRQLVCTFIQSTHLQNLDLCYAKIPNTSALLHSQKYIQTRLKQRTTARTHGHTETRT
jgi:hypothetical protein